MVKKYIKFARFRDTTSISQNGKCSEISKKEERLHKNFKENGNVKVTYANSDSSGRTQTEKDRLAEAITEDIIKILKVEKR
jgi:hypothetical protein